MFRHDPVMQVDASEARNAIRSATAIGVPPRVIKVFIAAALSSSVDASVEIQPGATLFTVMPFSFP
jgi:hypothetical protein